LGKKKLDIPQDLLEHAVYQQLWSGGARIMGKNPEFTMQLTGVENLLKLLIKDLEKNLPLIQKKKYSQFLHEFESKFDLDLSHTLERIETNLGGMGAYNDVDNDQPDVMIHYMILTKLLEALRDHSYQIWGYGQIQEKYTKSTGHAFTEKARDKLQQLGALNEPNYSLLYNLSFILMLGLHYGSKKFQRTIKRLTTTRVNRIVELI
jgi:hypothetical protein